MTEQELLQEIQKMLDQAFDRWLKEVVRICTEQTSAEMDALIREKIMPSLKTIQEQNEQILERLGGKRTQCQVLEFPVQKAEGSDAVQSDLSERPASKAEMEPPTEKH